MPASGDIRSRIEKLDFHPIGLSLDLENFFFSSAIVEVGLGITSLRISNRLPFNSGES
jgi:hypothetical protein